MGRGMSNCKACEGKVLTARMTGDKREANMPAMGAEILRSVGNRADPNWLDVRPRDVAKYLRERHWIKQWSGKRWPRGSYIGMSSKKELRAAELDRALDDPGDAFFELTLTNRRLDALTTVRTWVEVREVFLPGQATKVNRFVREYNGIRGKGTIDGSEFLRGLDLGVPDAGVQREMADEVVRAVIEKAKKGVVGGSYRPLVNDYGRGVLIVGLPLWFAAWPETLTEPATLIDKFVPRVLLGFQAIGRNVLRQPWCPFDSVVVIWNPTLESVDSWAKAADSAFYSDPANVTWRSPVSLLKASSLVELGKSMNFTVRWDRYPSVDAAIADQMRRFRFGRGAQPFGVKAKFRVVPMKTGIGRKGWRFRIRVWLLQLLFFVGLNGLGGLRRWIVSRVSPAEFVGRWKMRRELKHLYGEGPGMTR